MPAVKTYTNDGSLIRPKFNTEAFKDLQKISNDLRIAAQQKKLFQVQAFEKVTQEHVADYIKLRENAIEKKQGVERLDLLGYIQAIENSAAMTSDGQNFGLHGYAELYKQKFQFDQGANFDKEERKISEQISNVVDQVRNRFRQQND